jgi:hypothetical protein
MSAARFLICALALASLAALTGCPGRTSHSSAAAHDVPYYNAHPQERQATLDRCGALDQATLAADKDCTSALYSSLYGPSQLKTTASPK